MNNALALQQNNFGMFPLKIFKIAMLVIIYNGVLIGDFFNTKFFLHNNVMAPATTCRLCRGLRRIDLIVVSSPSIHYSCKGKPDIHYSQSAAKASRTLSLTQTSEYMGFMECHSSLVFLYFCSRKQNEIFSQHGLPEKLQLRFNISSLVVLHSVKQQSESRE